MDYRGNKFYEFIILSVAVIIAITALMVIKKSFWFILPYLLLETVIIYFFRNYRYTIDRNFLQIHYAFIPWKKIPIRTIQKIVILDKRKYEPEFVPHQVEIYFDIDSKIIVSPKNPVDFIENIEAINPHVEII